MDLIDVHGRTMGASESDDAVQKVASDYANIFQLMVENPGRYLFDLYDGPVPPAPGASDGPPRLVFPKDRLYGREESSALLASIFHRVVSKGGHEAVTVSGYSGIGKTSLVQQLRQPTLDRGGFFLAGKFDALQQARPLSAIVSALNTYCDDLVSRRNDVNFIQIQAAIQGAVEEGSALLAQLIPNLKVLMAGPTGPSAQSARNADLYANADAETVDSQAMNRLMRCFQKLFNAMAAPTHPVVFFLDDLQWADDLSLALIKSVLSEDDKKAFLLIGCYRSNEVEEGHSLLSHLDNIRLAGVTVTSIALSNMSKGSINALISDMLQLSPLLTEPLAETVHSKTAGNCLFVVELLADLERQGLLHYSLRTQRWEWDADAISTMRIHTNVVDLMRRKLIRLGATESLAIKIAACLGAEASVPTLRVLSCGLGLPEESSLATILQHTVEEGLMYRSGDSFRFSHDQIQQAAYSLICFNERASFHLMIGRSLEARALMTSAEGTLFTCVDQFNRGLPLIKSRSERSNLTNLNLRAGKAAILSSAYPTAAVYLRMAASLLDDDAWECHYDLCLDIYNCLAEAEYATGKYEEMTFALNKILDRARVYDHKLRAYYTLMSASAAQNDLKAAISIGFEVLAQLGETFDENANMQTILTELSYTKGMLVSKDRQWFRTHHIMSDEQKLYAMKFLYVLVLYVFLTGGSRASLLACRMIQLSVQYGLCKQSAFGFAVYGMALCGALADYEEAYEAGKLAWVIMDNFQAKDIVARCSTVVCGCINIWVEPLQAILPQLMEAYNATISSGDPEFALLSLRHYIAISLHSGRPLGDAADHCRTLVKDATLYRMQLMSTLNESLWQAIMNLSERCGSSDPTILSGQVMQEEEYILSLTEKNNNIGTCFFYLMKLTLACIFGSFDLAVNMHKKCMEYDLPKTMMGKFESITCTFYGGLAALVMKRERPEESASYEDVINNSIDKMEKWASVSSWNCEHKLALLQAETLWTSGDMQGAAKAYEKATRLALEHGFPNEEGLARERYGAFLSSDEIGDGVFSRRQYDLAYEAYAKWGAQRKCLELQVQGYTNGSRSN
jgi:predicted ATPase